MFYVTLPSNSSMSYYPQNTLTHYHTKLPHALDLKGEWEVGLAELLYPHTWYNVRGKECWFSIRPEGQGSLYLTLNEGQYNTNEKLLKTMSALVDSMGGKGIELYYEDITQKVTININEGYTMTLSAALGRLLGLSSGTYEAGVHTSSHVVDVNQGFYSLYVYCNISEPRLVGDSLVPLLRIVPVKGKDGETIIKSYENIHYVPVQQKHFDTLEIDIRDDTGKPIPFERGKLVTTLHFKRRKRF